MILFLFPAKSVNKTIKIHIFILIQLKINSEILNLLVFYSFLALKQLISLYIFYMLMKQKF
jgi:hypothetical protein